VKLDRPRARITNAVDSGNAVWLEDCAGAADEHTQAPPARPRRMLRRRLGRHERRETLTFVPMRTTTSQSRRDGMLRFACLVLAFAGMAGSVIAQDEYQPYYGGGDYYGPASVGSSEPLFSYDDQEPWKHGYLQVMPFYGGHHLFLPYNYKSLLAQSQVAAGWGMPNVMPYSQQFWHRYAPQAELSQPRLETTPVPQPGHFPPSTVPQQWYGPTSQVAPQSGASPTSYEAPRTPVPAPRSTTPPRRVPVQRAPRLP
jgi:hypothetical protein